MSTKTYRVTLELSVNESAAVLGAIVAQRIEAERLRDKYHSVGASFARGHENMYALEAQRLTRAEAKLRAALP
jgi:hypothetical protein